MGKELPLTNILNFEEYDGDLLEMELLHKDEETDEVSFPRLDFLYEKAEQLLIPQEEEG
jgi:hypothetical protein